MLSCSPLCITFEANFLRGSVQARRRQRIPQGLYFSQFFFVEGGKAVGVRSSGVDSAEAKLSLPEASREPRPKLGAYVIWGIRIVGACCYIGGGS